MVLCSSGVLGYPTSNEVAKETQQPSMVEDSLGMAYRMVQGCGDKDMMLCLKMRMLTYVDRALRKSDDIPLIDGISLVRAETEENSRILNGRALSEDELDASLPKDAESRDTQVENMLVERVARFLESRTLQLKVPESSINDMKKTLEEGKT